MPRKHPPNVGGAGTANRKRLLLTGDKLRSAYRQVERTAKELGLSVSANVSTPHCIVNPRDYPYIHFTSCGTSIDSMPLVLEATGNIRLCNHSPVILGNIHSEVIDAILTKPYLTEFFSCVPDICVDCAQFERCRGGCKAVSEQLGIPLSEHNPISSAVLSK